MHVPNKSARLDLPWVPPDGLARSRPRRVKMTGAGLVLVFFSVLLALGGMAAGFGLRDAAIRGAAECMGYWSFPDERPLQFEEVLSACKPRGTVLHTSINWPIGLTQGYVLVRNKTG